MPSVNEEEIGLEEPIVEEEEIIVEEEDEKNDGKPKTKKQMLRDRLRRLKMKTNQARQLNRQEVVREGERLGSVEGMVKERKRQAKQDKKLREKEWESHNAKALQMAAETGIDGKALAEPALESIVSDVFALCGVLYFFSFTHAYAIFRLCRANRKRVPERQKRRRGLNMTSMIITIQRRIINIINEVWLDLQSTVQTMWIPRHSIQWWRWVRPVKKMPENGKVRDD